MSVTLVKLKTEDLHKNGIPFTAQTILNWKRQGKYPHIFAKIGGRVFIVLEKWEELVLSQTGKVEKRGGKQKCK